MSAAKVTFWDEDWEPTDGPPMYFGFACPLHVGRRCEGLVIKGPHAFPHGLKHDPQGQNGGIAQWDWDGNRVVPTFTPSVNCGGCWHGYIRAGRCVEPNGEETS